MLKLYVGLIGTSLPSTFSEVSLTILVHVPDKWHFIPGLGNNGMEIDCSSCMIKCKLIRWHEKLVKIYVGNQLKAYTLLADLTVAWSMLLNHLLPCSNWCDDVTIAYNHPLPQESSNKWNWCCHLVMIRNGYFTEEIWEAVIWCHSSGTWAPFSGSGLG